jgi:hypothetical protein
MGYYTTYKLKIEPELSISEVNQVLTQGDRDGYWFDADSGMRDAKWYDHEPDMRALSRLNPDHLFILDGEGEEQGDVWRKYFKGGKCQEWRPSEQIPEPFDASKLK